MYPFKTRHWGQSLEWDNFFVCARVRVCVVVVLVVGGGGGVEFWWSLVEIGRLQAVLLSAQE